MKLQKTIVLTVFVSLLQIPAFAEGKSGLAISVVAETSMQPFNENSSSYHPKKKKKSKKKKGRCDAYGR